jgi:hypothetical protein
VAYEDILEEVRNDERQGKAQGSVDHFAASVRNDIQKTINRMIRPEHIDRLIALTSSAAGIVGASCINLLFSFTKYGTIHPLLSYSLTNISHCYTVLYLFVEMINR